MKVVTPAPHPTTRYTFTEPPFLPFIVTMSADNTNQNRYDIPQNQHT